MAAVGGPTSSSMFGSASRSRGGAPRWMRLGAMCVMLAAPAGVRADELGSGAADPFDSIGTYYSYLDDLTGNGYVMDGCVPGCDEDWLDDDECDEVCNVEDCMYDGDDCFHDHDECYNEEDGADYRGTVSSTKEGLLCQFWSHQWPQTHVKTYVNFPLSGVGGHNYCRNPDQDLKPWCFTMDPDKRWDYCEVKPPRTTPCNQTLAPFVPNVTDLAINTMITATAPEHGYMFYNVQIPSNIFFVKIVVVPVGTNTGDPDLFISFTQELPTGSNYTFMQDRVGVDEFKIGRQNKYFCNGDEGECTLYVSVLAYDDDTKYALQVLGVKKSYFEKESDDDSSMLCAAGCEWLFIGDGKCNPQCNNTACFWDRDDCAAGSTGCTPDCHPDWIGDHYCDEACFNPNCEWDKRDCLKKGQKRGCSDGCLPDLLSDGECDAACNTESCDYDKGDCFHDHDECYNREDGADYRGQISHTQKGVECQMWSEQYPQAHTKTHAKYPRAGLGGHNFCRNPDAEARPWCYTMDPGLRWDFCDVGKASEGPCQSPNPPPPAPPSPTTPPPPPPPPPLPPPNPPPWSPPLPCPDKCADMKDGNCDEECNLPSCLWDNGDCGSVVDELLDVVGGLSVDTDKISEIIASQGGFMQKAMYGGILLGLLGGCCTALGLCYLRRKRRKLQLTNRKYTPYGEPEDGEAPPMDPAGPDSADVIDPDAK